jgi:hypothetical protein
MTKKHFEFTAALINAAAKGVGPEALATMAAAKFTEDNPRFDADRFKRACGLPWSAIDQGDPLPPPPATIEVRDGDYWEGLVRRASTK